MRATFGASGDLKLRRPAMSMFCFIVVFVVFSVHERDA
jgi:hypothetical protein